MTNIRMAPTNSAPPLLDAALTAALTRAQQQVNSVVLGKSPQVRLAFACFLAGGHLLIEDMPGVGKTTLAHALAATLDLSFQRVQFTSDLLPSDIIGVSIYERERNQFKFHPGPLFAGVSGTTVVLTIPTEAGRDYVIQYRDKLEAGDWAPIKTIHGDGSAMIVTDTTTNSNSRYYRFVLQP